MMLAIVAIAALLVVYTLALYPVLIALLARIWPAKLQVDPTFEPTVTACIPVYNAAALIGPKIESLLSQSYPQEKLEIIIYTDGCTDESDVVVRQHMARIPRLKLVSNPVRAGKPTGLERMRAASTGDVLLMTDVRQVLAPETLGTLLRVLSDPSVGTVGGNLLLRGESGPGLYWRYEQWIRNSEAHFRSMLGTLGCLYVVRKQDVPPIPPDTILDDLWIPMHLRLKGRRLLFCKEAIAYDDAFDDDREFSRKVRTLGGNCQLLARMPKLALPFVNPSWFEMWSHKILRLVLPWALLALLTSSLLGMTEHPLLRVLVLGQALFYLLAIFGAQAGKLGAFARTFVILNLATVVGLWRFCRGTLAVTWVPTPERGIGSAPPGGAHG